MRFRETYSGHFTAVTTWCAILAAGIVGCAGVDTSESQLFGNRGNCKSATITYRVEHEADGGEVPRSAIAKLLHPRGAARKAEPRVTKLAVQYPHPAGRAGYARVECVTARAPSAADAQRGWLQRIRRLADDTLPGIRMADGVDEALGMDVPIGELDDVLAKLQQPAGVVNVAAERAANGAATQVACTIDNVAIPTRQVRIAELEKLAARVRREGGIISYTSTSIEPIAERAGETLASASLPPPAVASESPAQSAQQDVATQAEAQRDAAVQPANYAQPTTLHWPQADTAAP